ncbi:MAG: peptidoglycan DD-metalloendopeptidase family protein [Oscillospiraceae bacterium]|nr:peptidoglycan DD-metalloendopeptidase family protein [Oscillospiraceae bacterium]
MKNKLFRSLLSFSLCFLVLLAPAANIKSSAATQSELEEQLAEFERQKEEINKKLNDLKAEKADQQSYQNTLSQKINLMNTQLNSLQSEISTMNTQILTMENEIAEKEKEINENWELFKARLRAIYMTDDTSYIAAVLGAGSYSDMLMKSETLKRISEHDNALIADLQADIKKIEENKAGIEENKSSVVSMKAIAEGQLSELDAAYAESELALSHMKDQESQYNEDIEAIQREKEAVMREIEAIINQNNSEGTVSSTTWTWPVPTSRYITSYFNALDSIRDYRAHTGIDIAAPKNTPIVAANSGTVIAVVTNYTPGVGYGKYVMIDHGSSVYTLYAHCESISAYVGQVVSAGQTIAYVGTTGNSSGYHLHFGVSIKKSGVNYWQNPLNYVSR